MDSLNKLEEMINSFPLHFGKDLQQNLLFLVEKAKKEVEEEYVLRDYSITWSVADFVSRAETAHGSDWKKYFDEELFEDALYNMINAHDANHGITWETIDFYLDIECKI